MEKCPRCENPYLAVRQDIYKDERNFLYCDMCGFLIEEAAIGLISPRCAVIDHPPRPMIPLDEVVKDICKDNPVFAAHLLEERKRIQKELGVESKFVVIQTNGEWGITLGEKGFFSKWFDKHTMDELAEWLNSLDRI